jgi:hypothetical protein
MKFAIRIFALSVVVAGVTAAAVTPKTVTTFQSRQSATANLPGPSNMQYPVCCRVQ